MAIIHTKCLQSSFISFTKLNADWKGDKRYPDQAIQKFITFNRDVFSFLGISASLNEVNYEKGLQLKASSYLGASPLRMPSSGKYYTDIQITSRFGENISELAYLLQDSLEPEYLDKGLNFPDSLRAPFYFDCINYFNSFFKAISEQWNKFESVTKIESHPCSSTNWLNYAQNSINPANALKYENKKNILSKNHMEWKELTYILYVALSEFESFKTPSLIKQRYISTVSILKRYLYENPRVKPTGIFQIRSFEPTKIKELKNNANKVLEHCTSNNKAWRIDSAELFERFVQYVLGQVGQINGANVISNNKFPIWGEHRPSWILRYLEPDVILHKGDTLYFADAKYKAHMLNTQSSTDAFKEAFRADLHQVLAYSSFDASKNKTALLVYPCDKLKNISLEAVNNISNVHNRIILIGLPFTTIGVDAFIIQLSELLKN